MSIPEAQNTVFSNVSRFRVDFAFNRFSDDFPGFRRKPDLAAQIAAYHARKAWDGPLRDLTLRDLEAIVLERWQAR